LADFSGQFGGNIPLFEVILPVETKLSLSLSVEKVKEFLNLPIIREKKNRNKNFTEVRPLFWPFLTFLYKVSRKFGRKFVQPLYFLFGPF
jgi:hypothetical protein